MLMLEDKYGMIIDKILNKYINTTEFGWEEDSDYCAEVDNIESFIYSRPAELASLGRMWAKTGATKMVVGSDELDYVLKVPFMGTFYENWINDEESECIFSEFYHGDYCYDEVEIYKHAVDFGVEKIFAKTEAFADLECGIIVYKQPKVLSFNHSSGSRRPSPAAVKRAEELRYNSSFKSSWVAQVIDQYGEEFFDKLLEFIDDICPEVGQDMHCGNYGYTYDGKPIILDYAGYFE